MGDRRFAEGTSVPVAKSRAEIEAMLTRSGARSFASGWDGSAAVIMFELGGRRMRFALPHPDPSAKEFTLDHYGRSRPKGAAEKLYEAELRRRWRALCPNVCPDCFAVGDEPCAPDCIEVAMARDYGAGDEDEDDTCVRDDCTECDCSRCLDDYARWASWQGWDDDGGANGAD